MIKLVRATRTCMACPSQWDAWDEHGNYYYLRFRHSHGTMTQYRTENWVDVSYDWDKESGIPFFHQNPEFVREVASFDMDEEDCGWIELPEFARLAGVELDSSLYETGYGDHLRDELIMEGLTFFLDGTGDPIAADQDENPQGPEEGTTPPGP